MMVHACVEQEVNLCDKAATKDAVNEVIHFFDVRCVEQEEIMCP